VIGLALVDLLFHGLIFGLCIFDLPWIFCGHNSIEAVSCIDRAFSL
jgi:hypothetical protein